MNQLRIHFSGHSSDYSHPADRRRVLYWTRARGHKLVGENSSPDLVILSSRANFPYWLNKRRFSPIVVDLVDGYLGQTPIHIDYLRGLSKSLSRQLSGIPRKFTKTIQVACEIASAVICETPEQREGILEFNSNVYSILDFHEEFPFLESNLKESSLYPIIFWEGLPYTSGGLNECADALFKAKLAHQARFVMVTDLYYKKYLGTFYEKSTLELVDSVSNNLGQSFEIKPWSLAEVAKSAKNSTIAILPIYRNSHLANLKAENRMLIMWRLGLPVLASPTPAYSRVMQAAGLSGLCHSREDWTMKIEHLLTDPQERKRNLFLGRQYIEKFHTKERLLEKWDNAIESALKT